MSGISSIITKDFPREVGDIVGSKKATIASDIAYGQVVTFTRSTVTTGKGAVTRALKVLSADKTAGTGNASRALEVITAASAGSFADVEVGDLIEIGGAAAGKVIAKTSSTTLVMDASGTIGAGTWTVQKPAFAKVFPGATLVLATGTTTVVVESKTSDYAVNTVTSGTITTGTFTYSNLDSLVPWKEDGSRGIPHAIATEAFTYSADETEKFIGYKATGAYPRKIISTADTAAGSVTDAIHDELEKYSKFGTLYQIVEF